MRFLDFLCLCFSLTLCLCFIQTSQAAIFKFDQSIISSTQVRVSLLADDLTLIRQLYSLGAGADINFTELSGYLSFSNAWGNVPLVADSFNVNRLTDSLNLLSSNTEKTLVFTSVINSSAPTNPVTANEALFSFIIDNPQQVSGMISLNNIFLGAGTAPLVEDLPLILQTLQPADLSGTLAQATIMPSSIPIPATAFLMLTGMFLMSGYRRFK